MSSTAYAASAESTMCGFEGNNDIYGIGIRIGIYCQIIAVWVANYFLFSEAQVLRDSVSIFSVAILIVTILYAAGPSNVFAVEAFVLLQILAWSCMMGVRAKSSYSKGVFNQGSLLRRTICEVVNLVNICLHVWFWWTGMDQMKRTPCGTFLMMYVVKTGMFGWARKVMMAMSLFVLICTVYWLSVEASRPWTLWKIRKAQVEFSQDVEHWIKTQDSGSERHSENTQDSPGERSSVDTFNYKPSHDGCSKYSCPRCSPTRTDFILHRSNSEPLNRAPENPKRLSRATICGIPSLSHSTFPPEDKTSAVECSVNTQLQLLQEVHEAEKYIRFCISASPYQRNADGKPLTYPMILRSIIYPQKYRSPTEGRPNPPSWFTCHVRTWKAFATLRFPSQGLIVYSHLRRAQLLDPLSGPFQSYAAITYQNPDASANNASALPTWSAVTLASDLLLGERTPPKKVWLGWYYALLDLFIHIIVIVQLELTLHWNSVSGLSDLWTSVGQLVPFIIGVSGLGLVLTRWVVKCWIKRQRRFARTAGGAEGDDLAAGVGKEELHVEAFGLQKHVREGYERWKKTSLVVDLP